MKISRFYAAACVAALAVMSVSCEEENFFKSGKGIQFDVRTAGPMQTKSDATIETESIDLVVDDVKLTLTATAAPILDDPFSSFETKATAVNSADDFSSFKMNISQIGEVTMTKSSNGWTIKRENGQYYKWPDNTPSSGLIFDSMYGEGATLSGNTVSYNMFKSGTTMVDSDLLIGRTFANKNDVPVTLYHPLAALRFKVNEFIKDFDVTGIELSNMFTTGKFTVPASGNVNEDLELSFSWNNLSSTKTVYADVYETAEDELFIIPQTTQGVQMTINFKKGNGAVKSLTVDMPNAGLADGKWQAGYFYTYTITGGGFVEIEAQDKMNGSATAVTGATKTDVKAVNKGSLPVYVRAFVVVNWYNEAGKIIAPYEGSISYNTVDWAMGSDGFYYHLTEVAVDASTEDLISSFTPSITDNAPDGTGFELHPEMRVIFQAVDSFNGDEVWPELTTLHIIK